MACPRAADAVSEAFVRLHKDGLVYRGSYMVNWAPKLQTAVSDLEVEYTEENGSLYFFKYTLADDPTAFLPVATTRPETILGDTAVAVNPEDPRFKDFVGRECEVRLGTCACPAAPLEGVAGAHALCMHFRMVCCPLQVLHCCLPWPDMATVQVMCVCL